MGFMIVSSDHEYDPEDIGARKVEDPRERMEAAVKKVREDAMIPPGNREQRRLAAKMQRRSQKEKNLCSHS